MLGQVVGHSGQPLSPHDAWSAWSFDPLVLAVLGLGIGLYVRGTRPGESDRRRHAFSAAVVVLVVALMSPIDALADTLLSFHMIQHVLLVSVAAALLAFADPWPVMRRGLPTSMRRGLSGARRGAGIGIDQVRQLRHPVLRYVAFVATMWVWHGARLYDLAVDNRWAHALEHTMFVGAAILVWTLMVGAARQRADLGAAVALAFGLVVQGVGLSALMVFARQPWYSVYADPDPAWGLSALDDQHLAGLIMWFIGGAVFIVTGIALAIRWIETSTPEPARSPSGRGGGLVADSTPKSSVS